MNYSVDWDGPGERNGTTVNFRKMFFDAVEMFELGMDRDLFLAFVGSDHNDLFAYVKSHDVDLYEKYLEVFWLALYTDKPFSLGYTGDSRSTRTHKRIENGFNIIGELLKAPLHDPYRLLRRVNPYIITFADHTVPAPINSPYGLIKVSPCKLAVGKVVFPVLLIPNQPAGTRREVKIVSPKNYLVLGAIPDVSH